MSMFSALVPKDQDTDFGTESYEELVDNYCAALEDVEGELAGLEELGESIDNAEAFNSAIEACGATPALMQFGFNVDGDFEQLIGRAAPSDFATEDMQEFGTFAMESIKSKLTIAWEHVKTFIQRLIEKIKEFGRWVLRLFDRKKARLDKIIMGKADKVFDAKNISGRFIGKADCLGGISAMESAMSSSNSFAIPKTWNRTGFTQFCASFKSVTGAGEAGVESGAIELKVLVDKHIKQQTLSSAGFNKATDIIEVAKKAKALLEKRADFEKALRNSDQVMGKIAEAAEAGKRTINDKGVEKGVATYDKGRADQIKYARKAAIVCSKYCVCIGKGINNLAAAVIAVGSAAGL